MKATLRIIVVLLILNIGFLLYLAIFDKSEIVKYVPKIEMKYQDTGTHSISYKPYPVLVKQDSGWKYYDVDTDAILADYYSTKLYDSILKDDTVLFLRFFASVKKNALDSFRVDYAVRRPITIIQYLPNVKLPENYFYLSVRAAFIYKSDLFICADYIRKNTLYGLDYSPFTKSIGIKIGYRFYQK